MSSWRYATLRHGVMLKDITRVTTYFEWHNAYVVHGVMPLELWRYVKRHNSSYVLTRVMSF